MVGTSCTIEIAVIDHVSQAEESQLTARDNLRTVETEMVRPGAAALTLYHDE